MRSDAQLNENAYIINPENEAEMARLMNQDRIITRGMGGLVPEQHTETMAALNDMLDIASGPGGWVLEVAQAYQDIEVVGIDISRTMINYARAQALSQGLENATFVVMDALRPFTFSDGSFDLVNARFVVTFMPKTAWSGLLRECMRVLRPGGILRFTESELPTTTSMAFEQMASLFARALQQTGNSFSPDGRHIGVTAVLGQFMREVGCQNIRNFATAIDFSAGTDVHRALCENFSIALQLIEPLFLRLGLTTEEEFEHLYLQMQIEMLMNDFSAIWPYLTVYGEKPGL